ncbi:Crp/Fnr family transcriptional regulator [Cohnella suwonensis]|uniref:Crp/Fnr family transcriptional regulator n=1 Tax=Cohnella suwonensis TaxID=696072 RepID=A0ABW0LWT4_9BACL
MRKIKETAAVREQLEVYRLNGAFDARTEAAMELHAFDKGETVYAADAPIDYFYLLVKGKVKIFRVLPNGKSMLIRFYGPLSTIGDLEMLNGMTARSTVESVNDTLFVAIPRQAYVETAYKDPAFLRFVIKHLAHKLHTFSNASGLNLLYPVETRFASYLVSIAVDENDRETIEEIKTAKLTEIAELLGTSYRHLNRVVTQFASDGLVERTRGALYVKDFGRLKKLANGNLYS